MGPKRKRNTDAPYGGILTLSNLEKMTEDEQTARIKAAVNDIRATIIFLSEHAHADTLKPDQTHPLYNLLDDIVWVGREERKRLKLDLEECERELKNCERELEEQERQHELHIEAVKEAARAELRRLCREIKRLSFGKTTASRSWSEPRVEACLKNGTETQVENKDERKKPENMFMGDKPAGKDAMKSHLVDSNPAVDKPVEECLIQVRKENDSNIEDKPLEGKAADEQPVKDGVGDQVGTFMPDTPDVNDQRTDGEIKEVERTDTESASN